MGKGKMTTKEAYIALNLLPKIGPVRVRKLLDRFETPQAILSANRNQILELDGFGQEMANLVVQWEDRIDLKRELDLIKDAKVEVITPACEDYPPSLREIYDPPSVLYVWGQLTKADWRGIGVVGSRRATHYGLQAAKKLSYQIARAGLTVISGLARGVDTAAHEGALAGGRTIAVLGSGLGKLYPPENQVLAEKIAQQGAVVSEFPILYLPDKQSFPLRNRIVSGWSSGILVVEAPQRSGSLITANQAAEQGRPVYAVPGPIDRPTSQGCHRLIQEGAKLVMGVEDILEEFGQLELLSEDEAEETRPDLSEEESALFALLSGMEVGIEDLIRQADLPSQVVATTLMRLEMKRLVKQLPGKHFVRC
jgi:DNA processing protein